MKNKVFAVAAAFGMPNMPNGFLAVGTHVAPAPEIASAFVVDIFRTSRSAVAPLEGVAVMEITEEMARAMVKAHEDNAKAEEAGRVLPFAIVPAEPPPVSDNEADARREQDAAHGIFNAPHPLGDDSDNGHALNCRKRWGGTCDCGLSQPGDSA